MVDPHPEVVDPPELEAVAVDNSKNKSKNNEVKKYYHDDLEPDVCIGSPGTNG